jgi:transposase
MSATEQNGRIYVYPGGSISALAKELNIGRASLYRAFEEFRRAGLIVKDGRQIEITDLDGLSNIE